MTHLFVRKNNNPLPQRVYLDKNTKIQSIEFEKKGGSVVLGDSTVVIGNLEGGTSSSLTTK